MISVEFAFLTWRSSLPAGRWARQRSNERGDQQPARVCRRAPSSAIGRRQFGRHSRAISEAKRARYKPARWLAAIQIGAPREPMRPVAA